MHCKSVSNHYLLGAKLIARIVIRALAMLRIQHSPQDVTSAAGSLSQSVPYFEMP